MPKDYARRSQKTWQNKNDKRRLPWIAILLLIIIIALLAAAIIYIKMQKNITTTPESTNTGAIVQQAKPVEIKQEETAAPEKRIQKPRPIKFDFYSMLPNMKVLSLASLIALTIKNIHEDGSVSSLFRGDV